MVAYHAGLFNIGGEGRPPWAVLGSRWCFCRLPLAALGAGAAGRRWSGRGLSVRLGRGPGLACRRGAAAISSSPPSCSNFIAAALLNYLLVNVLRPPGSMDPPRQFSAATACPNFHDMALALISSSNGVKNTPANITPVHRAAGLRAGLAADLAHAAGL